MTFDQIVASVADSKTGLEIASSCLIRRFSGMNSVGRTKYKQKGS